jgi:CTP-dependent riboflavin kinase
VRLSKIVIPDLIGNPDFSILVNRGNRMKSKYVDIKGRVTEGLREASHFTDIPWVKEQFINKLGIDPYPGTLNLVIIDPEDLAKLDNIRNQKSIEIVPEDPTYCPAKCFPVLINNKIAGAIVIPLISQYPRSKLEIIATEKIMDILNLDMGETVTISILVGNS